MSDDCGTSSPFCGALLVATQSHWLCCFVWVLGCCGFWCEALVHSVIDIGTRIVVGVEYFSVCAGSLDGFHELWLFNIYQLLMSQPQTRKRLKLYWLHHIVKGIYIMWEYILSQSVVRTPFLWSGCGGLGHGLLCIPLCDPLSLGGIQCNWEHMTHFCFLFHRPLIL